jgi:hypothetical protein
VAGRRSSLSRGRCGEVLTRGAWWLLLVGPATSPLAAMANVDEPVHLVPHRAEWVAEALAEIARIAHALSVPTSDVEHIGSTAVPGLAAKPVIDLMVGSTEYPPSPSLQSGVARLGYERWVRLAFRAAFTFASEVSRVSTCTSCVRAVNTGATTPHCGTTCEVVQQLGSGTLKRKFVHYPPARVRFCRTPLLRHQSLPHCWKRRLLATLAANNRWRGP